MHIVEIENLEFVRMHIVELICENLDFGKHPIQFTLVCLRLLICGSLDLFGQGGPHVIDVVSCKGSSIHRADTVGCSPETPVIVVVSGHARAWRDGSISCSSETPVVVVVFSSAHAWRAGSNGCFFETPVVIVVYCHVRAWRDGSWNSSAAFARRSVMAATVLVIFGVIACRVGDVGNDEGGRSSRWRQGGGRLTW